MCSQIETSDFHQAMLKSFTNIFTHDNSRQDILDVIHAIKNKEPILPIMESEKGSFSTIFLPFHAGQTVPFNFKKILQSSKIHPKLIAFFELSGQIESMTDQYSTYEEEPNSIEKQDLLRKLEEFLRLLPSRDEFKTWL